MSSSKSQNLKELLTINEAAELLGVNKMTLRRWDVSGKLKAYRNPMNKYRLYKREELEALLREITKR
ncbi:MAG: MerR family transcriptional regulator [Candidatus Melainabacteria bacterium]|jgi:excisionase family DNA binding protein